MRKCCDWSNVSKWFVKFHAGDFLLDDAPWSGRLIKLIVIKLRHWEQSTSYDRGNSWHTQNIQPLKIICNRFSSVQFSRSVMSNSLLPHELQHARPPCPSPTPGVHSNSCPLSQWCHPAISNHHHHHQKEDNTQNGGKDNQRCAGKGLTTSLAVGRHSPKLKCCQFPLCKYDRHGWFKLLIA